MRTEAEMIQEILSFAEQDNRIKIVTLEGSRTNPNVPKDIFQDYDISFFVTEMDSFKTDHSWVDRFGKRIIMQMPEAMSMFPPELGNRFSYLMLFEDGNRIDLTLIPLEERFAYIIEDKLMQVLLDKENLMPPVDPPTDRDYWVKRPSEAFYHDCCNEFWWVSTYVAKGLWRQEILYAIDHLNFNVRPMLMKMLEWRIGIDTDFSISTGKNAKYMEQYLTNDHWQKLMSTFPAGNYSSVWQALYSTTELFGETAKEVAKQEGWKYAEADAQQVTAYLKQTELLDRHATSFD